MTFIPFLKGAGSTSCLRIQRPLSEGRSVGAGRRWHPGESRLAANRKAFHDYAIEEKIEAGLILQGTEVKCSLALPRLG